VETDEFNTLGIPEDSNETRGIIESWITSNKEKIKRAIPLLLKILIQVNSLVCPSNLKKSIEVAKFGTSYISIIGKRAWNRSS
jgi:hypothetical protein